MMKKGVIAAMLGAAAMAMSAGALAQQAETGWYAGGSIGQSDLGPDTATSFKITGGYQINRNFGVELSYADLGDVDVPTLPGFPAANVGATAFELVAVGKFPVANQFSIYGLAGFARIESEASMFGVSVSDTSMELTYGFGVQYDFSRQVGLRAQWQTYDADVEADVMSVGVVVRF